MPAEDRAKCAAGASECTNGRDHKPCHANLIVGAHSPHYAATATCRHTANFAHTADPDRGSENAAVQEIGQRL